MPKTDDTVRDHQDQASLAPINTSSDVELMIVIDPAREGNPVYLAHRAYSLQWTYPDKAGTSVYASIRSLGEGLYED